jgi:hypothetical protein
MGCPALGAAIRKYGEDAFVFMELEFFATSEGLNQAEVFFIAQRGARSPRGYNLTDGGEGALGYRHSADWRATKSASMKGKTPTTLIEAARRANTGRKHSPDRVAAASSRMKGRRPPDEVKNKGKIDSVEVRSRKKTAQRARGHQLTYNGKTQCLTEWSEEIGIAISTLFNRILHGWSDERILSTPDRETRFGITFGGETHTISGWARSLGVSRKTITARIAAGWSLEETLTTGKLKPYEKAKIAAKITAEIAV